MDAIEQVKTDGQIGQQLIEALHRGGVAAYYWTLPDKLTHWHPVGKNGVVPVARDVYFPVHPTKAIKRNDQRATKKDKDVCVVNSVFAEYDAKDRRYLNPTEQAEYDRIEADHKAELGVHKIKYKAWVAGGRVGDEPIAPKKKEHAFDLEPAKSKALEHIRSLRLAPSTIVDSGGGYHCYWLLEHTFIIATDADRARITHLQARWVDVMGGDTGAKDLERVLRVPGTTNGKPKYKTPLPVTVIDAPFTRYALSQIESLAPVLPDEAARPLALAKARAEAASVEGGWTVAQIGRIAKKFGEANNIADILKQNAYSVIGNKVWRPGKSTDEMPSGNIKDDGYFSFSSNDTDFGAMEMGDPAYSAFAAWAVFDHAGDQQTAASAVNVSMKLGMTPKVAPATSDATPSPAALVKREEERREYLPQAETPFTDDDKKLADFKPDDDGNADAFISVYGSRYVYTTALGWQQWAGTHWKRQDADAAVVIDMIAVLRKRQAAAALVDRQSVLKAAQPSRKNIDAAISLLQKKLRVSEADFDTHPDLLNVRNGVVNLRTGEITPHDPALKITHYVDVDYKKDAETKLITDFLLQAVKGGMQVVKWLQMWLGYCMTGETHIEQMLYLWGAARAGKGTLMEAIAGLLGGVLVQSVNFATFAEKRDPDSQNFDLAVLRAARFVIADESPKGGSRNKLDAEKIKKITGGGTITCSFKHRDQFTYKPRFKIGLISNFPLNADVDDDAMWGRVNIVEMPNSHLGNEDVSIKQNFKTRRWQEALLAFLVDGSMLMYRLGNGAITSPAAMSSDKERTRDLLDTVGQWLDECTEKIEGADAPLVFVTNPILRASYEQWCKQNGHIPNSSKGITQTLQRRKFGVGDSKKIDGKTERIVTGLRIIR